MKRFVLIWVMFASISCGMAPLAMIGLSVAGGYATAEVVDAVTDDSGPTTVEVAEGGEVTVVNEAEELPDTAIGLVAFMLSHIYEVIAAFLFFWLLPSPAAIRKHIKRWRRKAKEKLNIDQDTE